MSYSFTVFDWVLLGIIVVSIGVSFFRGFLREVLSLVTWALSIVLAIQFSPVLSQEISWFQSETLRYLAAFALIFVVVWLIGFVASRLLSSLSHKVGFGTPDHILGIAFGAVRGLIAVVVLLSMINVTPFATAPWYQNSKVAIPLHSTLQWFEGFFPEGISHINSLMSQGNRLISNDNVTLAHSAFKS